MKYESIVEFTATTKCSKSKIYRFYNENKELFEETKLKGKRMFPITHARYFSSEIMFDENNILRKENTTMRNLIDCLVDKNSLESKLWHMDWSFFCTVAYKADRDKKGCFRQMHAVYDFLASKYAETEIRIFFTTEKFSNRNGYHNHFVIYVGDSKLHQKVIADIKDFFSYDKTDFRQYDKRKAGLFYMSKTGLINEDWDIIYNKLDEEK